MGSKTGPPLIQVPNLFSIVEAGVYRCASPTAAQVKPPKVPLVAHSQIPFLATLNLRTIVSLTPEHPIAPLLTSVRANGIEFVSSRVIRRADARFISGRRSGDRPIIGSRCTMSSSKQPWRWRSIRDTTRSFSLTRELTGSTITDPGSSTSLGIHQTGVVVGCLRIMQGWNFASILVEVGQRYPPAADFQYRAHSGPTKHRISDEQYIEASSPFCSTSRLTSSSSTPSSSPFRPRSTSPSGGIRQTPKAPHCPSQTHHPLQPGHPHQ